VAPFFTDRDLGQQFPDILAAAGLVVHRHSAHFLPSGSDEDWLRLVGANGWVAITHDKRIRYKPNELAAVEEHGVRLLVVVGKAPFPQLAKHFVDTVPRVDDFLNAHQPPFIGKVYGPTAKELIINPNAPGTVSLWYPPS